MLTTLITSINNLGAMLSESYDVPSRFMMVRNELTNGKTNYQQLYEQISPHDWVNYTGRTKHKSLIMQLICIAHSQDNHCCDNMSGFVAFIIQKISFNHPELLRNQAFWVLVGAAGHQQTFRDIIFEAIYRRLAPVTRALLAAKQTVDPEYFHRYLNTPQDGRTLLQYACSKSYPPTERSKDNLKAQQQEIITLIGFLLANHKPQLERGAPPAYQQPPSYLDAACQRTTAQQLYEKTGKDPHKKVETRTFYEYYDPKTNCNVYVCYESTTIHLYDPETGSYIPTEYHYEYDADRQLYFYRIGDRNYYLHRPKK